MVGDEPVHILGVFLLGRTKIVNRNRARFEPMESGQ